MSIGATSGVFLRCSSWHDSVTVLTASRWQRKALAAGTKYRTEGNILCNYVTYPSCLITPHSWSTSSDPSGWVGNIPRPAVSWLEVRRSCVGLWNGGSAIAVVGICLKDLISKCDCLSVYTQTLSSNRQHFASEDNSWRVCVLLCSWTCSSSFCVITVSTVQLQTTGFEQ